MAVVVTGGGTVVAVAGVDVTSVAVGAVFVVAVAGVDVAGVAVVGTSGTIITIVGGG